MKEKKSKETLFQIVLELHENICGLTHKSKY